jgi:hypothetical protein
MASRSKRHRSEPSMPVASSEDELTDADTDGADGADAAGPANTPPAPPARVAGEPPPSRGDQSICLQDYCAACSELPNLLAEAAVGRAGDAAWLYCVLGVSELRAAVLPRLKHWVLDVEIMCQGGEALDASAMKDAITTYLHKGPAERNNPAWRRMTEQQQSEARARYNDAKAIVAPVLRMLCDQEPRSVCPRWKRLEALPLEKLCTLKTPPTSPTCNVGADRDLADELRNDLYERTTSGVLTYEQGRKLLTACVADAPATRAPTQPFHDPVGQDPHLGGYSFGPHGQTLLALSRDVCEVCVGLGMGRTCTSWSGPGDGYRCRDINCVTVQLGCGAEMPPGSPWAYAPACMRVLYARPPCIDAQLVSLPRRGGAAIDGVSGPSAGTALARGQHDAAGYLPPTFLTEMCRTSALPTHVTRNRRLFQAMMRVLDSAKGPANQTTKTDEPPLLQRHALDRKLGATTMTQVFGPNRGTSAAAAGTLHAHFADPEDEEYGDARYTVPYRSMRAVSRAAARGGGVYQWQGTQGGVPVTPFAWLRAHPSIERAKTVQGALDMSEDLMQRAEARVLLEDGARAAVYAATRAEQAKLWRALLDVQLGDYGVRVPHTLVDLDARLPGARGAFEHLLGSVTPDRIFDPNDIPGFPMMARALSRLDGDLDQSTASGSARSYVYGLYKVGVCTGETRSTDAELVRHWSRVHAEAGSPGVARAKVVAAVAFDRIEPQGIQLIESAASSQRMWIVPCAGSEQDRPVMGPLIDVPVTALRRLAGFVAREIKAFADQPNRNMAASLYALQHEMQEAQHEDPKGWGGVRGRAQWLVDTAARLAVQHSWSEGSLRLRACALSLLVGPDPQRWVNEVGRVTPSTHTRLPSALPA